MGVSHLFAALLAAGAASPQASSLELLIPAYFYPTSWTPENYYWDELRDAAKSGVPMTVIMNPANGHEPMNPTYLTEFRQLKDAKSESGRPASVIAYISTCWATNPCDQQASPAQPGTEKFEEALARITSEIDVYASYYATNGYTLQGVFLDEMSTQASALPFYQRVATHVRTNHPGWTIADPGGRHGRWTLASLGEAEPRRLSPRIVDSTRNGGHADGIRIIRIAATMVRAEEAHIDISW